MPDREQPDGARQNLYIAGNIFILPSGTRTAFTVRGLSLVVTGVREIIVRDA